MSRTPGGANPQPKRNYATPPDVIAIARALLGGIDLDPASNAACNERVGATLWLGPEHHAEICRDGLARSWGPCAGQPSRVFLNPPGGLGGSAKRWWSKLIAEYTAGRVASAFFVAFSIDALQWAQSVHPGGLLAFPCWVPAKRIAYLDYESGIVDTSPPKPSVLVWLPAQSDRTLPAHVLRQRFAEVAGIVYPGTACGGDP